MTSQLRYPMSNFPPILGRKFQRNIASSRTENNLVTVQNPWDVAAKLAP